MGYALAAAAARRGAAVTVVAANVSLAPPPGVHIVAVQTAAELQQACEQHFEVSDVLLMSAAVADFRPAHPTATKLKKDADAPPAIELEATEDVLSGLAARRRPGQVLVGFAAEHGDRAIDYGRRKLERKHLDAIVVNDISRPGIGFDAPENEVVILSPTGERHVDRTSKERVARRCSTRSRRCAERGREAMEPPEPPPPVASHECEAAAAIARRIAANVARAVQVRPETLEHVLVAMLAEGHVLVEDYPGVGKTALARAIARSIDCQFARIQCTSDLLPADVVGTNVSDQREQRFSCPARCSPTSRWSTRSTARRRRRSWDCLERMAGTPGTVDVEIHELACLFSSWRPRIRSSTRAPTRWPRPRWTVDGPGISARLLRPEGVRDARDHEAVTRCG